MRLVQTLKLPIQQCHQTPHWQWTWHTVLTMPHMLQCTLYLLGLLQNGIFSAVLFYSALPPGTASLLHC